MTNGLTYPKYFTEEEKEAFDKIRKVAYEIGAGALIVNEKEKDSVILIELPKAATPSDWDKLNSINISESCLMADFCYACEGVEGRSYAIR